MAYIDIYAAAVVPDSTLHKQIAVACVKASVDIFNEAGNAANHSNRLCWARDSVRDPLGMATKLVWKVLENATIQAAPTTASDSDVQFVVNSLIDSYANG